MICGAPSSRNSPGGEVLAAARMDVSLHHPRRYANSPERAVAWMPAEMAERHRLHCLHIARDVGHRSVIREVS
jgi:hypothetical protein